MDPWPTELFDIMNAQVRIIYKNAAGEFGSYLVTNKFITNGICSFAWEVDANALKEKGNVEFWVCAEMLDGSTVKREWHTLKAIGNVAEGFIPRDSLSGHRVKRRSHAAISVCQTSVG